jgi:cardiolipin synthase A/B
VEGSGADIELKTGNVAGRVPGVSIVPQRGNGESLAQRAFTRAAQAELIEGNAVRLLKDAEENYPAWLQAIGQARHHIHFESYAIHNDETGREFAEALIAKAQAGVAVRVIYDWFGGLGSASPLFWKRLRNGRVEVRCYNPPGLDSPFSWIARDHRKMIEVDGEVGFISGLCVGKLWVGNPEKGVAPWRDTGVEIRGPAVSEISAAFAQVWAMLGEPLPPLDSPEQSALAGDTRVRVVATMPMTAGISRVDELVAALARERLWLTDAYYAGLTSYVQALTSAARGGVDVRLLVPGGSDIPLLRPLSRAGYRPLLDAGIRVFEWNGSMLHAKTAVADGKWARVGSSNLNAWSWFGNCELDLVVEDERFGKEMEEMYLADLENATEIVLDPRNRVRSPNHSRAVAHQGGGSAGRAVSGTLRIGRAVSAALTNSRPFEPVEARILMATAFLLFGIATLFWFYPKALMYPVVVLAAWLGASLFYRSLKLYRRRFRRKGNKTG